ncbi:MAG: DUF4129 domain-containing transglutaminase family protein [Thermoguttaceae bacterium]
MKHSLQTALILDLMTCLSALMLGLGQNDFLLPVFMLIAAATSFYWADRRRVIQLGDWTVNGFVLLIVLFTFGDVLRNQHEDLAFAIARVLVFVEMVLLFREKSPRFCWQILLISLLQVVVATVMQQSPFFFVLLIGYIFASFAAFVLIFLQKEHEYYRNNSFVETFWHSLRSEFSVRQDRRRLARLALLTLLTGPLALLFSFSAPNSDETDESAENNRDENSFDGKKSPTTSSKRLALINMLRPLFAFTTRQREINRLPWKRSFESAHPLSLAASKSPASRFPLLDESPQIVAGTVAPSPLPGGRQELFFQILRSLLVSLLGATILFCLLPRFGRVDFYRFSFQSGRDHWASVIRKPVATVGFREEVRLGSLGTVLPHYKSVMLAKFMKIPSRTIPDNLSSFNEEPYSELAGTSIYFDGTVLDQYARGTWKATKYPPRNFWDNAGTLQNVPHFLADTVHSDESASLFFTKEADLIAINLIIQPLDSTVFFAPRPFFCSFSSNINLRSNAGRVDEPELRNREKDATIFSTAFQRGIQLPLVPCLSFTETSNINHIPNEGLSSLIALARQWDNESGLPQEKMIERARFLEQQLIHSGRFSYKLGGTTRSFGVDPLEDFVSKNPTGHCEYFAGTLAMMLRAIGIGSRVVIGFKTDSSPTSTNPHEIRVRQSDAHAWVEAFIPTEFLLDSKEFMNYDQNKQITSETENWWKHGGWLRLDPTPPSGEDGMFRSFSFGWTDLNMSIQQIWSDMVLNFNGQKQMEWIYRPFYQIGTSVVQSLFNKQFWKLESQKFVESIKSFLPSNPNNGNNNSSNNISNDWWTITTPFLLLFILVWLSMWLLRSRLDCFKHRWIPTLSNRKSTAFYEQLEKLLKQHGYHRNINETPLEFVKKIPFSDDISPIVRLYYRVRFGNSELQYDESDEIQVVLKMLKQKLKCDEKK